MMLYIETDGRVNGPKLRESVFEGLKSLLKQAEYCLNENANQAFWRYLHQVIVSSYLDEDKQSLLEVEAQINGLPLFIETWIKTAVESPERFEMFIKIKAAEVGSGDEKHDYYEALLIRHDQLVALREVLGTLLKHIDRWLTMRAEEVVEDEVYVGLIDYSIEQQIYLEAQRIHRLRTEVKTN